MSIQDLGAIGEFLGSIFVLVTLIYLAVQVRHSRDLLEENRKLALSAVYQARTGFRISLAVDSMDDSWVNIQSKLFNGYEFQQVDIQIPNFEKLTVEEKLKVVFWHEARTHIRDNALFQIDLGFADEHLLETTEQGIRLLYPLWIHIGISIPPRIQEWYEQNKSDAEHI